MWDTGGMSKASEEASRQLDRIVALGYADVADMSEDAFRALAQPLIAALEHSDLGGDILSDPHARAGLPGIADRPDQHQPHGRIHHHASARHRQLPAAGRVHPARGAVLPGGRTAHRHLLHQPRTRRGAQTHRLRRAAAAHPGGRGSPIATQHPEWLLEKNGFNLLGSRSADGRVPSIWMSQNAPRLGAVWPNSRHTWLGNAYCMARRGVSLFP